MSWITRPVARNMQQTFFSWSIPSLRTTNDKCTAVCWFQHRHKGSWIQYVVPRFEWDRWLIREALTPAFALVQ
jgi:hypothetical protein